LPYIGEGPLWHPDQGAPAYLSSKNCRKNWWSNLLYVNNFVDVGHACMSWTWYLANDFQFYLVAPLLLVCLLLVPIIGLVVLLLILGGTCLGVALLVVAKHYPPTLIFKGSDPFMFVNVLDSLSDLTTYLPSLRGYYADIYVKPWSRCGTYLVGVLLGYVLHRTQNRIRLRPLFTILLWAASAGLCLLVLFGLTGFAKQTLPITSTATGFYASLHRLGWSVGIAIIVYLCVHGYGGVMNWLLCLRIWRPASRMSYCLYLVHPVVIGWYHMSLHTGFSYSDWAVFYQFIGNLFCSVLVAFGVCVLFEAPFVALTKLFYANPADAFENVADGENGLNNKRNLKEGEVKS